MKTIAEENETLRMNALHDDEANTQPEADVDDEVEEDDDEDFEDEDADEADEEDVAPPVPPTATRL